jgi:hypothetical protein
VKFVFIAIFFFSAAASAAKDTAAAGPMIVPQAKFVADIQVSLPKLFCDEKTYFRKCFQISAEECATTANSAVADCAKDDHKRLPASFKQPEDGRKWGQAIGTCAGSKFEQTMVAKMVTSADCKNPEKWK